MTVFAKVALILQRQDRLWQILEATKNSNENLACFIFQRFILRILHKNIPRLLFHRVVNSNIYPSVFCFWKSALDWKCHLWKNWLTKQGSTNTARWQYAQNSMLCRWGLQGKPEFPYQCLRVWRIKSLLSCSKLSEVYLTEF